MKIVTAAEMHEIDRATVERYGVASLTLMENAGRAVAEFALEQYPEAQRIVVVCGKGNNGGDGFVAARHLAAAGKSVRVVLLVRAGEVKGDAAAMLAKLPFAPLEVDSEEALAREFARADLFVDAVLGTGFKPPVSGLYAAAIRAMNAGGAPVVAVDVPSGADSDGMQAQSGEAIVCADTCVTFTAPKAVHVFGDAVRGATVVASIGSPEEAIVGELGLNAITPSDFAVLLKERPRESNKGLYGHALIVAGSFGKSGAAAMAGMACMRSGAGLTTVATPKSVLTSVASFAAELMTEPLEETETGTVALQNRQFLQGLARKMTVLALGPGLTQDSQTVELVRELVRTVEIPLVVDADGLNALAGHTEVLKQRRGAAILTPHPGEMARLVGKTTKEIQADRVGIAKAFAKEHDCVLVLKGDKTVVASPAGEVWINCTGNPGMATGGTGDVLTGMVAGLLAQHPKEPLRCAIGAVYLHGMAGDLARDEFGEMSVIATDLIRALPQAIRRAKQQGDRLR